MQKRYMSLTAEWWWGKSVMIVTSDVTATVSLSILNESPESGYVNSLVVRDSLRRRGLGREMMQEVERVARGMGLERLYLGARKTSFVTGWYMRLGYSVSEENTEENPTLMFTMIKDLK